MEFQESQITVFCGPMKSGKSKELFNVIDWLDHKTIPYVIFKPDIDSRDEDSIGTRFLNQKTKSINISATNPKDMLKHIDVTKLPLAVIIDEAQFFSHSIVDIVKYLSSLGVSLFIGGLDLDARKCTFGSMGELLALADNIKKVTSVCEICKATAAKTALQNASPEFDKSNIVIEKQDFYIVVCNNCFNQKVDIQKLKQKAEQ